MFNNSVYGLFAKEFYEVEYLQIATKSLAAISQSK